MKTKFLLPLCISVVMGAMVFISCEHEQNYSESIQNEEVNQFLQSSYGKDFLENFHFQIEDLNVEKLASLSQKNNVKLLCIPVTKNEKELGRLCVISNSQGRIFQALYEDWSEVNTEEGGMMKNMTIQIKWMMGMLVLLLAGCDKESDDMVLPVGRREIVVSGVGTGFVQKRDAIGQNETGPKFGEFYFLKTMVLNNQPLSLRRGMQSIS